MCSTVSQLMTNIFAYTGYLRPDEPADFRASIGTSYFNVMESSGSELFCLNFGGLYVYDKSYLVL